MAKTTLTGEKVWSKSFPANCGFYGEKSRFSPTNVAFAPDGGFYVADGYGSNYIHQYDADANWVRTWGGTGTRIGTMKTPHSIWLDDRPGRNPNLVVADRRPQRGCSSLRWAGECTWVKLFVEGSLNISYACNNQIYFARKLLSSFQFHRRAYSKFMAQD